MLYVRHIERGHDEVIYDARYIKFTRKSGSDEPDAGLHLTLPDKAQICLNSGLAYVMGENGQTIAKYNLDDMLHGKQGRRS